MTLVFSKDRALQLDAFLRSYAAYVGRGVVHVLWTASTPRHEAAYRALPPRPWVRMVAQSDAFQADVLALVPTVGTVLLFVDDQLFVRRWDGTGTPGLSLRLGLHLTHDYAAGGAAQPLPPAWAVGDDQIAWHWRDGAYAWGYPLSLDGHVFDAREFRQMLEAITCTSPNTLEAALQVFRPQWLDRVGRCYRAAKVVNLPWNLVQTDWVNPHGTTHHADALLTYWEAGQQIALGPLAGVLNTSTHQEYPLTLEPRAS